MNVRLEQSLIDYYERRSPNPTLDVMQKIAAALEICVTELLGEEAVAVRKARNNGPVGRVREVFDLVSKLPRRQHEHIVDWVSAYVSQYEQTRQG